MQYFEGNTSYNAIPAWAAAMLGLGYRWDLAESRARRIGLLSTPCESEAAGLISLGALRRDLERASANHLDTHFDLLRRACRERISDQSRRQDSDEEPSWDVRHVVNDKRWRFISYDDNLNTIVVESATYRPIIRRKGKSIPNPNGACNTYIHQGNATNWQLRDFPLPQLPTGGKALECSVYGALPSCDGPILEENMIQSYDGLVLVGQGAAPDSVYMQKFYETGFKYADYQYSLGDLLTLHHSERNYIRRLRFLNERADQDSGIHEARLVVADGISALLRADNLFPYSDIIGVCNRDASIEAIQQLKEWLNGAIRYYSDANTSHCLLSDIPSGMLLRVIQRRA